MRLWEMLSCEEPFSSMRRWDIPVAVAAGKRPPIPPGVNSDYAKAMELCWHQNPEKRPPFWMLYRIFEQLEAQL